MKKIGSSQQRKPHHRRTLAAQACLRELMKKYGSQVAVQDKIGLRQRTVSNIKKGKHEAGNKTIKTLCDALKMTEETFLEQYAPVRKPDPQGRWKYLVDKMSGLMEYDLARDYVDEMEQLQRRNLLPQGCEKLNDLVKNHDALRNQILSESQPIKAEKSSG